jgi:hypothetical protein
MRDSVGMVVIIVRMERRKKASLVMVSWCVCV